MKKIAVITTGLSKVLADEKCGGGEILLKNLILNLIQIPDINLSVFTVDEKALTLELKAKYPQINFIIYNQSPSSYSYINELNKIFETEYFDKIINYNMVVPFKTAILQSHSYIYKLNKAFFLFRPIKNFILRHKLLIQRRAFERAKYDTNFIAVSQIIKDDYCKNFNIPSHKIKVIYPGVNTNTINEIKKKNVITFGIAANSSINKGGHYFLFALGVLNLLKFNFNLQIIAPKFKQDILMRFIINIFGFGKKVTPLPFQNNMSDFYNTIDFLILPSLNEAFGLVTLESMAHGKPCLVSSTAGCSEIITKDNGFIFNRNSFVDFIKKLIMIIKLYENDFNLYLKMSQTAKNTAKEYSWLNFAKKAVEVDE